MVYVSLIFWQHLAAGLSRSEAFIVAIFFRNIDRVEAKTQDDTLETRAQT
jgi:hypothetical protein